MTFATVFGTGGHQSFSETYTAGGYYYANVGLGRSPMETGGFTVEESATQIIRVPGTFSTLTWGLDTDFPATLTLTLKTNGTASVLAVSFSSTTTGTITDSTHSVSVAAGDTLDFAAHVLPGYTGTYSGSFYGISALFVCAAQSAQMLVAAGPASVGVSTAMAFVNFLGVLGLGSTVESQTQFECWASGTWQNMACHVGANSFNESTTITNRKNGPDGSMSISVGAAKTGYFEDMTHSDTVAAGDLWNYALAAASNGNGNAIGVDWIGAHFLGVSPSTGPQCVIGGTEGGQVQINSEQTRYSSLFGGGTDGIFTTRSTGLLPGAFNASNFTNLLTGSQHGAGTATFNLLINGGLSGVATSSSAGATGQFTDTTHTVNVVAGDSTVNEIVGTGGSVMWAGAGLLLEE